MRRPVIGVTVDTVDAEPIRYMSDSRYAAAVEQAGGLPLLLPYRADVSQVAAYVDLLDGIVFTGGNDLDPHAYGEQWHPKAARIDPPRQHFETALLAEVERRRVPALGICLGSQLMNVARGGTLHQFIPDLGLAEGLEHRRLKLGSRRHPVTVDTSTRLGAAIGRQDVSANTSHKQAVRTLGRGLRVIATAPDGIIEGFEDPSFPLFAAVQWHPERLTDEPEHFGPFRLLIETAAGAGRAGGG